MQPRREIASCKKCPIIMKIIRVKNYQAIIGHYNCKKDLYAHGLSHQEKKTRKTEITNVRLICTKSYINANYDRNGRNDSTCKE